MPRFTKTTDDGRKVTVETAIPREAAELRSQGFTEQKARTVAVREADAAKTEAPKVEAPKADAPKADATKSSK